MVIRQKFAVWPAEKKSVRIPYSFLQRRSQSFISQRTVAACGLIQLPKYGNALPDFLQEANRILDAAKDEQVLLRLLGALAFRMHCPNFSYLQEMLGRTFTDIDFASYHRESSRINKLFVDLGYQYDVRVRTLFGSRLVFYDIGGTNRHCDVFLDKLEFCHDIDFENRLEVDYPTIPLVELLLEKMQIVKLNEKDVIDTIMLLREHEIGDSDKETINVDRLAKLTGHDWGLWKTVTTNLEKVRTAAQTNQKLSEEDKKDVDAKITAIRARIDAESKSRGWRMRAAIGEKRQWYRDVDELVRE
jgi:hypothetical protein